MQETGGFRLIVRRGPQPNQSFDLNKDIVTLGRDITNDIVINDPEVSRHHLRFTRGADGYNIEDLGSTNGTFIGGQRLSGVRTLNRGDLIGLGETVTLVYEAVRQEGAAAGEAPAASPPTAESQQPYSQQPQQQQPPPQQQAPPPQQQSYGGQGQAMDYQQPQQQQGDYYQQDPSSPTPPQPEYGQQPGYGGDEYGGYGGAPGYDPYAVREDEPASPWRWVVLGCLGLLGFCCCATSIGLLIIDTADLWCDIPVFSDIITPIFGWLSEAFGLVQDARTC